MQIAGTVAFVTGASGGIGRCLVSALLQRGAGRIYAADLPDRRFGDADPRIVPISLDITDEQSVARAAAIASNVQILINNAGVNLRAPFISAPSIASARREI